MGGRPTDATLGYRVTLLGVSNVTMSNVIMKLYYEIIDALFPLLALPPPSAAATSLASAIAVVAVAVLIVLLLAAAFHRVRVPLLLGGSLLWLWLWLLSTPKRSM